MGTKYSSQTASGYNATPPDDDGTVSEANKVKWSSVKTKLSDPLSTLAAAINTALTTHFDNGPTALTTNTTLGASHYNKVIQVSGSGVTLTLSDAATLTAGWFCWIRNTDSSNSVTIGRATGADTFNGSAQNYTLGPGDAIMLCVVAAANGFVTLNPAFGLPHTIPGQITFSNLNIFSGVPTGKFPAFTNLTLTASVSSNALTIAIKGVDGNDPSATNPVYIPFRNATEATGDITWLSITAATSLVISSGSTVGSTSALKNRLWIVGFNDGGTFRLGAINCEPTYGVFATAISNDSVASSTAEGGAGAADSAGVFYTGSAVTSKAYRILGYVESTQATAGTWATSPSKVQVFTDGVRFPQLSAGEVKLTSGTGSSVASLAISLSSWTSLYNNFKINLFAVPATDAVDLFVRTSRDAGANLDSTANSYEYVNHGFNGATTDTSEYSTNATEVTMCGTATVGNAAAESIIVSLNIYNVNDTARIKLIRAFAQWTNATPNISGADIYAERKSLNSGLEAINGVGFLFSSGNIASYRYELYGLS